MSKPSPATLWAQAQEEFPRNGVRARRRYRELMKEAGHLVPGVPKPLPCGHDLRPAPGSSRR